jgi:hypothetical protein
MPTTQPDLIELSTDWDTALLVADRYTGTGRDSRGDTYFAEQGKRVFAAMLVVANKEGLGYGWIDKVLGEHNDSEIYTALRRVQQSATTDVGFPLRVLTKALWTAVNERSGIYSAACLMFTKALQPRSALPPGLLDPPETEEAIEAGAPSVNPFAGF